jgi:hypothetical protein
MGESGQLVFKLSSLPPIEKGDNLLPEFYPSTSLKIQSGPTAWHSMVFIDGSQILLV